MEKKRLIAALVFLVMMLIFAFWPKSEAAEIASPVQGQQEMAPESR